MDSKIVISSHSLFSCQILFFLYYSVFMSTIEIMLTVSTFFISLVIQTCCIWPPPYKIDLNHEETFVIDESIETVELQEVYDEDEVINDIEKRQLKIAPTHEKFYALHNSFKEKGESIYKTEYRKKKQVFEQSYPELEEPSDAVFVDKEGKLLSVLRKREGGQQGSVDQSYDYKDLKNEFENNLKEIKKSNETMEYIETTQETAPKGLLKALISSASNDTLNCTYSDKFGLSAVKCLISDLGQPKLRSKALDKLFRIMLVVFFVYLVIAIPLWCQYGWCCCCCRCKFCRPLDEIEDVKKFFVENPIGIYHDKEGNKHEYKPTIYERYAHKKLSQALESL